MEIDCPVLIPSASGAAARPFVTHHNDFDMNFYLRICNEIELKKATVGWLEKYLLLRQISATKAQIQVIFKSL